MKRAITVLVAVLAVLGLGISVAASAQAISRNHISLSFVDGTAYADNGGAQYHGALTAGAGTQGDCWYMARKTSAGTWVTSGFYLDDDGLEYNPIQSCGLYTHRMTHWHVNGGANVYGLRIQQIGTSDYWTFCDTKARCQSL